MNHQFDVDIAAEYGLHAAIILNNLQFWIAKNEANETNFFDGYYWTYNSIKAYRELFPYLSDRQISYALKKLEEEELIISGNYNKSPYDRTKWYAITKQGYSILQKRRIKYTKPTNRKVDNVEPIPDNNTDINTDNKTISKKVSSGYDEIINGYTSDNFLKSTIYEFIKMRKMIKKPLTDKALKLMLSKLDKMATSTGEKIAILNQSIMNSWQGIFELKESDKYIPPREETEGERLRREQQERIERMINGDG